MLKYLLLILINMVNIKGFAYNNVIKQTILHDSKMPSIYLEKCFYTDDSKFKNKFISAEHIFPQSLLMNKHSNDMHNIIKTIIFISNKGYVTDLDPICL